MQIFQMILRKEKFQKKYNIFVNFLIAIFFYFLRIFETHFDLVVTEIETKLNLTSKLKSQKLKMKILLNKNCATFGTKTPIWLLMREGGGFLHVVNYE